MKYRLAVPGDVDGVRALLSANHANNLTEEEKKKGFVTTNMTKEQMLALIEQERGISVAEENGRIYAFAMAGSWDFWSEWPLFQHMIEILPSYEFDGAPLDPATTYQYGPVCVDVSRRREGIFKELFAFSLGTMAERFPVMVTFVNKINPISYKAHSDGAGMDTVGTFDFNNNNYYMMACRTER